MKNKINTKKILKLAGNLIVIAALVFVVKKIAGMDIKLSDFKSAEVMSALIVTFIVQAILIVIACLPWLIFIRSLSGTKIPFSAAMPVYTKSNILKYVPGNVFQYIGRNQLAADMKISHVDVACATVLDIIMSIVSTGVISVILLGGRIAELLEKYGENILIVGIAAVAVIIIATIVLKLKFSDKVKSYTDRYKKALEPEKRSKFLMGAGYYFLQNLVSAAVYFLSLSLIIGTDAASLRELAALTGAFMFAWIVGFVTPGAPGGIGIRESVMLFVCGEQFSDKILLFVLVMRVASIFADIAAFLVGKIYEKVKTGKETSKIKN